MTDEQDPLGPLMRAVEEYATFSVPYLTAMEGPDELGEYEQRHYPDPTAGTQFEAKIAAVRRKAEQYGAMKVANVYAEECGIVRCACLMTGDRTSCAERAKTARAAYFEEEQR